MDVKEKKSDASAVKYPVLIAICGPKGCGKTTIANLGMTIGGTEIVALASSLKSIVKDIFKLSDEQVCGKDKETPFPAPKVATESNLRQVVARMKRALEDVSKKYGSKHDFNQYSIAVNKLCRGPFNSPRELMQKIGTEVMQSVYKMYSSVVTFYPISATPGVFFVDDMRFPQEDEMAKELFHFYYPVRVTGRNEDSTDTHQSEHAWKDIKFFSEIDNSGEIDDLKPKIIELLSSIKSDIKNKIKAGDIPQEKPNLTEPLKVGRGIMGVPTRTPVRW